MKIFILALTPFILTSCLKKEPISYGESSEKRKQEMGAKVSDDVKNIMKKANEELIQSGLAERALAEGNKLPDFEVKNEKGEMVKVSSLYAKNYLVITFYRGGWCPYCQLELKAYESMLDDFADAGAVVVGISPEVELELKKTRKKNDLSFPLFSDPNNEVAKKLGIAFTLNPEILAVYKKFGIDLEKSQNNKENTLPMPGTYVVDTTGKILFAFINPDYTLRAEPADVLKVIQKSKGLL